MTPTHLAYAGFFVMGFAGLLSIRSPAKTGAQLAFRVFLLLAGLGLVGGSWYLARRKGK